MTGLRKLLFALLCALILFSPALAEARAGGSARPGGSMGYSSSPSIGSRNYAPSSPSYQPYTAAPGFSQRHPFLTGLAGGSLFSWLFIIGIVWLVFRMFRRPGMPLTSPPYDDRSPLGSGPAAPALGYGASSRGTVAITQSDYDAFEAILKTVQGAWSKGDLGTLRHYVTPEVVEYFSNALANNSSQGVENHVEQVALIKGDVREAWDEGAMQYAACLLRWRAIDYTTRIGQAGAIVEGDPQHPSEAQELWTFARSPGGHWLLARIEQV
jgi:uncharacterized membrane protein